MPEPSEGPQIQNINLGDRIEVTFVEPRNIHLPAGMEITTVVIDPTVVRDELADLIDSAISLIDAYMERRRNPAPSIRG